MTHLAWHQGIDGCRGGWCAVRVLGGNFSQATWHFSKNLKDLLWDFHGISAIDMPIGLPHWTTTGGRQCDREVRRYLGARQSSVFSVPSRLAVYQSDYKDACDKALATSNPPRKISKQIYHIFPKIRELDALLPLPNGRIYEAHPEFAFVQSNNGQPLTTPKKIKGRPHLDGIRQRMELLGQIGYPTSHFQKLSTLPSNVAEDDFLDASILAWTAFRILRKNSICCPQNPPCDDRGLPMSIHG